MKKQIKKANKPSKAKKPALQKANHRKIEKELIARIQQQAAVAKLGQDALLGIELSKLFDEAVGIIAKTLNVEYCKVLELLSEGDVLLLRSGVGWKDGLVGHATVGARDNSQAGYTLLSSEPVIVEDLRTETRFTGPALLQEHGVVSGMSVIIHGKGRPFGVLGIHTTRLRFFTKDDIHFLQAVANVLANAIERKGTEESLARSKAEFEAMFNFIPDAVMFADINRRIVMCNPAVQAIFGYTHAELQGKTTEILYAEKSDYEEQGRLRYHVGAAGHERPYEMRYRRKDGTIFIAEALGSPVKDAIGKTLGFIAIFRDLAERKKMEENLIRTCKLESLGVLAGGIAHDFNNILTAILANVSLVKTYIKPEDFIYQRLSEAEKASIRARDLTQRLLIFAKGCAPVKKVASIAELVRESVDLALRGSDVGCDFSIPDDLWPAEVDEGQISQAIHNIVLNAVQSLTDCGAVHVHCENAAVGRNEAEKNPSLQKGNYVKISIKDNGIGIPAENLKKIFDPYFTTKPKGSGLGLATTYSIVKNHDGLITVESRAGVGTVFHIYLPASDKKIPAKQKEENSPIFGKGRVLVMDDEDMVRDVAGNVLKYIGYEAEAAKDGAEAIELYRKGMESGRPFDAVIMDITIPGGMGGKEAIKKLLEIDPNVKAIVSSGYSEDPVMAEFRKYGFCGVIAKPYEAEQLSRALSDVINGIKG